MRLLFWGLLFLLLLFGSAAGVASSFPDFDLAAVFALLFLVSLVGLLVTGLVYLVRSVRFGARETYGQPALTLRGEVVRSNSEKVIADWLFRRGIRYAYEQPIFDPRGRRVGVPDFYLPDYGLYVEYWGLVGTDRGYERRMERKKERYLRNGVRVVSLYQGDLRDLGSAFRSKIGQV